MSLPSVAEQGRLWLLLQEQFYKTPAYLTGFLTQETVCSGAPPRWLLFSFTKGLTVIPSHFSSASQEEGRHKRIHPLLLPNAFWLPRHQDQTL